MSFHAALSGAQLTKLRGSAAVPATYACAQHISVLRPATMLACRVNGTPTGTSFASIEFDTVTAGAYTNVIAGMTVLISHTNSQRAAFFVGRARNADSNTLNFNETSAGILNDDYVWVIQDWRLQIKLAREVSGVQYKDWDVSYTGQKPLIYNLQSVYWGWVDATTNVLSISFAPLDQPVESGATISTRVWSALPSGATLTAGSLSGANITVEFDPGDYWLEYTVTDDGGRPQVRHIPIFAIDDTINPPALSFSGASIQSSASGWAASLRGYNDIDDLLDGTLVVVANQEYYNGTEGSLFSNIAGVFRFRRESSEGKSDPTYSFVSDTGFELEDIATQLSRLYASRLAIRNVSSPSVWDEINDLTPYRAMVHLLETGSTFNGIHSLSFDAFDTTFEYDSFPTSGTLLSACTDIAKSINAVLEFAPDGRCIVSRHACHLTTAQRNALTTIANFTDGSGATIADIIDVTIVHNDTRDVGQMNGSGGTYNTTTGVVDAFLSISPGVAQEGGGDTRAISGQILAANSDAATAKAELITRSANELEIANGPDKLIIVFPDGYHFLIPSVAQWYTFTLTSAVNKRGITFDTSTRWLLESIAIEQDNDTGTKSVRATFVKETVGTGGIAFDAPKPGEIAPYVPDIPAFGPYDFAFPELPSLYLADNPSGVDVPVATIAPPAADAGLASIPRDGNTHLTGDASSVLVTRAFLKSANPPWTNVIPDTTHTVVAADFDPFPDSSGHVGAYILTTLNSYSYVWHTTNVFAAPVIWTQGATVAGAYTMLRTTSTKGGVLIYAPANAGVAWSQDYDFTAAQGDSVAWASQATYSAGVGWVVNTGAWPGVLSVSVNLPDPIIITNITATFTSNAAPNPVNGCALYADQTTEIYRNNSLAVAPGATIDSGAVSQLANTTADFTVSNIADISIAFVLTAMHVEGMLTGAAVVRYSDDYGATFGSAAALASSPGSVGGFDRIVIGNTSLAAADAQVQVATTLGGAYGNEANGAVAGTYPLAILIPSHKQNSTSTTNYNAAQPEYVLATPALVSGASLWWVKPASKTDITPTVSGNKGLAVSPDCLANYKGTLLAAILSFGGTRHLVVSSNGGTSWTDRGAVGATANCIKTRRRATSAGQIFFTDGNVVKYSPNKGATIVSKSTPSTGTLLFCEAWG